MKIIIINVNKYRRYILKLENTKVVLRNIVFKSQHDDMIMVTTRDIF